MTWETFKCRFSMWWPHIWFFRAYFAWNLQRDYELMHGLKPLPFLKIMAWEFGRDGHEMAEFKFRMPTVSWFIGKVLS